MAKQSKIIKAVQQVDWRVAIIAILVIGGLEALAMEKGMDGVVFSGALIIIAGLAGVTIRNPPK